MNARIILEEIRTQLSNEGVISFIFKKNKLCVLGKSHADSSTALTFTLNNDGTMILRREQRECYDDVYEYEMYNDDYKYTCEDILCNVERPYAENIMRLREVYRLHGRGISKKGKLMRELLSMRMTKSARNFAEN